jgi:hypothetical protein
VEEAADGEEVPVARAAVVMMVEDLMEYLLKARLKNRMMKGSKTYRKPRKNHTKPACNLQPDQLADIDF